MTYQLHYAPGDELLAFEARSALFGWYTEYLVQSTTDRADYHIAIVTNTTTRAWFEGLERFLPHLICVVAGSIHLPMEEAKLPQYQWVDYRLRSPEQLKTMKRLLKQGTPESGAYHYPVVPERLEKLVLPRAVWFFAHAIRTLALYTLAFGLTVAYFRLQPEWADISLPGGLPAFGIVLGLMLLWLADRVLTRNISFGVLMVVVGGTLVSMFFLGIDQFIFLVVGPLEGSVYLALPVIVLLLTARKMREWLPKQSWREWLRWRTPTLSPSAWQQRLLPSISYVFTAVLLAGIYIELIVIEVLHIV